MRLRHPNGLIHARKFQGGEIGVLSQLRSRSLRFYLFSMPLGCRYLPQGRRCLARGAWGHANTKESTLGEFHGEPRLTLIAKKKAGVIEVTPASKFRLFTASFSPDDLWSQRLVPRARAESKDPVRP